MAPGMARCCLLPRICCGMGSCIGRCVLGVDVLFGLWCLGYVCLIDGVVYVCTGVLRLDVLCLCVLVFIGKTLF